MGYYGNMGYYGTMKNDEICISFLDLGSVHHVDNATEAATEMNLKLEKKLNECST